MKPTRTKLSRASSLANRRQLAQAWKAPASAEMRYMASLRKIFQAYHAAILGSLAPALKNRVVKDAVRADLFRFDASDDMTPFENASSQLPHKLGAATKGAFDKMSQSIRSSTGDAMRVMGVAKSDLGLDTQIFKAREAAIALVENAGRVYADQVRKVMTDPANEGLHVDALKKKLMERGDVSMSRATLIARDQTLKLNSAIAKTRQNNAGITTYTWSTSHDERVREEHRDLDGQVFSWDNPPDVGNPGEDFQCRCVAIPNIDELDTITGDEPDPVEEPEPVVAPKPTLGSGVSSEMAHAAEILAKYGSPSDPLPAVPAKPKKAPKVKVPKKVPAPKPSVVAPPPVAPAPPKTTDPDDLMAALKKALQAVKAAPIVPKPELSPKEQVAIQKAKEAKELAEWSEKQAAAKAKLLSSLTPEQLVKKVQTVAEKKAKKASGYVTKAEDPTFDPRGKAGPIGTLENGNPVVTGGAAPGSHLKANSPLPRYQGAPNLEGPGKEAKATPSGESPEAFATRAESKAKALPAPVVSGVKQFTSAMYTDIREYERYPQDWEAAMRKQGWTESRIETVKKSKKALEKLGSDPKTHEPGVSYRGTYDLPKRVIEEWMANTGEFKFGFDNTGATTSSSWDPNVSVNGFMGTNGFGDIPGDDKHKAFFVIHGKTGVPVQSISGVGPDEREILFGVNAKFKIKGVSKWKGTDRTFVFELEEI